MIFSTNVAWPVLALAGISACAAPPKPKTPSVPISCVAETCAFSTNIAWDAEGKPDTRPGTWGTADSYSVPIPFTGVPAGYRVRVMRVYGDLVAWPHGEVKPGTFAGVLAGLVDSSANQSPFVGPGLGSQGCFMYIQAVVGQVGSRAGFDFRTDPAGLLGPDNVMSLKHAVFLNETGVSIHMETSAVVEFRYVKGGK